MLIEEVVDVDESSGGWKAGSEIRSTNLVVRSTDPGMSSKSGVSVQKVVEINQITSEVF